MSGRSPAPRHTTAADTTQAVDELMKALEHPAKDAIQALRAIVLEVDPAIREGVKWNAPSFRTSEYFATTHLRTKRGIGVILHFGAKVREVAAGRESIAMSALIRPMQAADVEDSRLTRGTSSAAWR